MLPDVSEAGGKGKRNAQEAPKAPLSLSLSAFLHALDQAVGPHVGPILIYEFETRGTTVGFVDYGPTGGHVNEAWPQRMLTFGIYQNMIDAIFVLEWIRHLVLHRTSDCLTGCCLPSSLARTLPIFSAGRASIIASCVQSSS